MGISKITFPDSTEKVKYLCKTLAIDAHKINSDFTVDVNGNVFINSENLDYFPIKFSHVGGQWFDCSDNRLQSLEGSPVYVAGEFDCGSNWLPSLVGGPEYVGGDYICSGNSLTDLNGSPRYIEGNFDFKDNRVRTLAGCPKEVEGKFLFQNNPIADVINLFGFAGYEKEKQKIILEFWDNYNPVSFENKNWYLNEKIFLELYYIVTGKQFGGKLENNFKYQRTLQDYTLIPLAS